MKKGIILLLCVLLLSGCAATYDGPTEYREVVWSVDEKHYDGDGNVTAACVISYSYDIYGYPAQQIVNTAEGDISKTLWKHDAEGHLLEQRDYDLTDWFPFADSVSTYSYDDQGRITRAEHRSGFETEVTTYTYDDEANTQTAASDDGTVVVCYLDENGRTVRSESFLYGSPGAVVEYTYDDQGRELSRTETMDGQILSVQRREYGEQKQTIYHADGSKTVLWYMDEACQQISEEFRYDPEGNLTFRSGYCFTRIRVPAEGRETS